MIIHSNQIDKTAERSYNASMVSTSIPIPRLRPNRENNYHRHCRSNRMTPLGMTTTKFLSSCVFLLVSTSVDAFTSTINQPLAFVLSKNGKPSSVRNDDGSRLYQSSRATNGPFDDALGRVLPKRRQNRMMDSSTINTIGTNTDIQSTFDVLDRMLDKFITLDVPSKSTTSTLIPQQQQGILDQQQKQQGALVSKTKAKASIPNLTISLIKQIVGGCILALPAGVASLGSNGSVDDSIVLPVAVSVMVVMGLLNAYFFSLIGRVCTWTGATTFQQAWEMSVGKESSQLITILLSMKTILSCLAYAIILGDSFANIVNQMHIVDHIITRSEALEVISIGILLPICLQQDLSSLMSFSLVGLIMILFTSATILIRAMDGTYQIAQTGTIPNPLIGQEQEIILTQSNTAVDTISTVLSTIGDTTATSSSTTVMDSVSSTLLTASNEAVSTLSSVMTNLASSSNVELLQNTAVLACTLISAFVAQYNAPRFHSELQNNTVERFNTVTGISYGFSTIVFITVALAGYTTFGTSAVPFVLNNYLIDDPLITMGNIAVAISICLTFPLPFFGLRDNILDATKVPIEQRTTPIIAGTSVALLMSIVLLASYITDLRAILSIGGGTFSTAVAAIFPTLMFRAAVAKNMGNDMNSNITNDAVSAASALNRISNVDDITNSKTIANYGNQQWNQMEANIATGLMMLCIGIGGTGVSIAVQNMV